MAGEIRNVVRRLDRSIPVVGLSTMERDIAASVADRQLIALALALYALLPLILRRGVTLVSIGIVTGLGGAFGLTRLIRGLLFGVEPTDPGTFLAVSVFVFLVAVVACAVRTWWAVRSDPKVALQAT